MAGEFVREGVAGSDDLSTSTATQIGKMAHRLEEIADDMGKAKDTDTARYQTLADEQKVIAADLSTLKDKHDAEIRETEVKAALDLAKEWKQRLSDVREPSKARLIGTGRPDRSGYKAGDFLYGVAAASGRDAEEQTKGKAILRELAETFGSQLADGTKAAAYQEAWGKAALGTTDATGGWIIPNAIVDELITPPQIQNIYRQLCTVVPGVTAYAVDIPFRSAARTRAAIAAFGATKENLDLAYNGYTATMYTLARIYDVSNQFLRQSRGAAEADALSELGAAFAQGEAYYIREGSGSSQPFGYTSALTNGPAAFRSTFSPSSTTLAGSMAVAIATAAGALAGRGVPTNELSAVLSATSYWTMLSQGTDNAGFFFSNPANSPVTIAPRTLISPFGIPVLPDSDADLEATAAVIDNLVVGNWKKLKVYFGESYRVDTSDVAGARWDTNLTGFRGEEEMGFDARPAVYAGHFQLITDIVP